MKFISVILFQLFLITLITSIKDRQFIDDKLKILPNEDNDLILSNFFIITKQT